MSTALSYGIAYLAAVCVFPFAVFLHELGHALPPIVAGGRADIVVGGTGGKTIEGGPISVTIGWDSPLSPLYFGYCDWEGVSSRSVRAIALASGPATTMLVLVAVVIGTATVRNDAIQFGLNGIFWHQLSVAAGTIVPMTYPSWFGKFAGDTSDGAKLLDLLRD